MSRLNRSIVWRACASALVCWALCACQAPQAATSADSISARYAEHRRLFSDFELPRRIGSVENIGLQLPVVAPDGEHVMYLRSDREWISPMTLLGSPKPEDTPSDGSLSLWIRPLRGTPEGQPIDAGRWVHSAVWSPAGDAILFVRNEPPVSSIIHLDLVSASQRVLGVPGLLNSMPRFDIDGAVLYCAAAEPDARFRVYRQTLESDPLPITPEEISCVLPIRSLSGGEVICAAADGDQLRWVCAGPNGTRELVGDCGASSSPAFLQVLAGMTAPLSPDGQGFLFFDAGTERIATWQGDCSGTLHRYHQSSHAAAWLTADAVAVATTEFLFAIQTSTGFSPTLLSGQWLPARYVDRRRALILFGRESGKRLSIHELVFRTREPASETTERGERK